MNFQEAFENLTTFDSSAEAIVFFGILLLTFIIGLLFWALFLHWPQRRRLRRDIESLHIHLNGLDSEHKQLLEKHSVQEAQLKRMEEAAGKFAKTISEKEEEIAQLHKNLAMTEADRNQTHKSMLAAERELQELKNLYKLSLAEMQEANSNEGNASEDLRAAFRKIEDMKGLIEEIEEDRQTAMEQLEEREQTVKNLSKELNHAQISIEELKKDLMKAVELLGQKEKTQPVQHEASTKVAETETLEEKIEENKADTPEESIPVEPIFIDPKYNNPQDIAVVLEIGKTIPKANGTAKNDLKKINGIGIFIEQKLNFLGIYNYEQIASFTPSFSEKLTEAIGFSKNAIERDRWVEQAKELLNQ